MTTTAAIVGDKVLVDLPPAVKEPKTLYFGWGNTDVPNLMGKNGLPVPQFRAQIAPLPK